MVGPRSLRLVGSTVFGLTVLATLPTLAAETEDTETICAAALSQAPVSVRYAERLSRGAKVIGAPLHLLHAQIDRCHLARWNEPEEDMHRMIAFVYNDSDRAFFNDARLTIWHERAPARAVSEHPVSIAPKRTAVFLFVGPIKAIKLAGFYAGPKVQFAERAPPDDCGTLRLDQTLEIVEAYEPKSTLRSRIPNLDPAVEVEVIRIQFTDTIIPAPTGQPSDEPHVEPLLEDRHAPAYIECS